MRRGLLAWNRDEVPVAALDARLARLQAAMARDGLGAMLIYTNFPRPAAVSFLTHFVPYWSQAALVVFDSGPTALVSALSKRVSGWVHETGHVGEIVSTGDIGAGAAKLIAARGAQRVGVVELAKLPGGIGKPFVEGLGDASVVDATALFASVRHPADEVEIAVSRKAARIAAGALDAALADRPATADRLIAAIESAARLAAAEEVIVNVAPDLAADARLARIEGDATLAGRFAVRASVASNGAWVRILRTIDRADGAGATAAAWTDAALARIVPNTGIAAPATASNEVRLVAATAEAQVGSPPLSVVAKLPAGSVASVSFHLADASGAWLSGTPVLVPAAPGTTTERLA
jgi:Creatinase/Prolidase N-terminal domain